jgi:hypothetical protein
MVKLIFLCRRRSDIGHGRYTELLLRGHVPIALRHHPTLRRYTVNIVEQSPAALPALDSIGELSFDTLADFRERLYDSAEGERAVQRDVSGFMGGAHAYATTEYEQKAGPAAQLGQRTSGIKMIAPLRRRPDLTHAQFVEHWLTRHVPLALEHHPLMTRYVTNVVDQRLSDDGDEWDGFAAISFAHPDDRTRMFASKEGERLVREDIARFIGFTAPYWCGEYAQR